jgi:hypothetical protein
MLDGDEHQRAAAAFLDVDRRDARQPVDLVADLQRMFERQPAARPHPPRQGHRRQEAATARMAVHVDFTVSRHRQEVQPVPERRQVGASYGLRVGSVERRRHGGDRRRGDGVRATFGAAQPGLQVFELHSSSIMAAVSTILCAAGKP